MTVLADIKAHSDVTTWVGIPANAPSYLENSTVFQDHELSEEANILLLKLNEFRLLPENWDSYGAEKPDPGLIHKAKRLVRELDRLGLPLFFIAPGPNGEIGIELKNKGRSAEIILENTGTIELLVSEGNELTYETEYQEEKELFRTLASMFSE